MGDPQPSLRPLRGAADDLELIASGTSDLQELRRSLLRVIHAIEASLRRLLRDEERAPLDLRLKALATDELSAPDVVAGLRQQGWFSIESAAAIHELWAVRRRLAGGEPPTPADTRLVLRVADRLEDQVLAAPTAPPAPSPPPEDRTLVQPLPPEPDPEMDVVSLRRRPPVWLPVAVAVLALVLLGVWWFIGRENDLEAGVERFRSGQVAEAVPYLERYAAAHPDDPTARLYLARIHRRARRFTEAGEQLRSALRYTPQDPAVHRELGFLLLDTGRPENAVQRFRTAVELEPDASDGWVGLVRALRAIGRYPEAERVLQGAPAEVRALLAETPALP